jgi:ABC-type Mn2+/Zn2+ transport system ATPase subunit
MAGGPWWIFVDQLRSGRITAGFESNGSGKTTFMLMRFAFTPDQFGAHLSGWTSSKEAAAIKPRQVGYMTQRTAL